MIVRHRSPHLYHTWLHLPTHPADRTATGSCGGMPVTICKPPCSFQNQKDGGMLPIDYQLTDVMIHKIGLSFRKKQMVCTTVSTGFPVARRCVPGGRPSRTRLSRCRADNDTAKNRDIRINNVFHGIWYLYE